MKSHYRWRKRTNCGFLPRDLFVKCFVSFYLHCWLHKLHTSELFEICLDLNMRLSVYELLSHICKPDICTQMKNFQMVIERIKWNTTLSIINHTTHIIRSEIKTRFELVGSVFSLIQTLQTSHRASSIFSLILLFNVHNDNKNGVAWLLNGNWLKHQNQIPFVRTKKSYHKCLVGVVFLLHLHLLLLLLLKYYHNEQIDI